ncbi:hypothetical protein EON65_18495 [archaeon]|nr:MAG: hypothetical protein EON65_18495 [archaeon]
MGKLRLLHDESWSSGEGIAGGTSGISPSVGGAHGSHVHGHGVAAVLSRYNFGSAPELLFKVREGVDVGKGSEGRPVEEIIDADKLTIKLKKHGDNR